MVKEGSLFSLFGRIEEGLCNINLFFKTENMNWFWRFSIAKSEKMAKNCYISIFGFHCIAKNKKVEALMKDSYIIVWVLARID